MIRKEKYISQRISDFLQTRISDYQMFYKDTKEHKEIGIFQSLNHGQEIFSHFEKIIEMVNEYLVGELFPQKFVNLKDFFAVASSIKEEISALKPLLLKNATETYYSPEIRKIVSELYSLMESVEVLGETGLVPYERIKLALQEERMADFFNYINSLLTSIPYELYKTQEGYLHSHLVLLFKLLGFQTSAESSTNIGRIDCVIELSDKIYLFEFKNGTAQKALDQIQKNQSFQKFLLDEKKIMMVGVSFDQKMKSIGEHIIKEKKT